MMSNQTDKPSTAERSLVMDLDQLPVEILEHIFIYLPLHDRNNIRLTCKAFYGICNLPQFLEKEQFVWHGEFDAHHQTAALMQTYRSVLHLQLRNVDINMASIPESFWEEIGDRIRSFAIIQNSDQFYSTTNSLVRNLLFYCTNLDFFAFDWVSTRYSGRIITEVFKLSPVSDAWSSKGVTIRSLKECSCLSASAKEIYASSYGTKDRIQMEAIYSNNDASGEWPINNFLLNRIIGLEEFVFEQYYSDSQYLGVRVCEDFDKLTTLKSIVRTASFRLGLVVRFDYSMDSSPKNLYSVSEASMSPSQLDKSYHSLEDLLHLTIYGGCHGALRIFENFALTSLKHLDIYASDVPSVTEPNEQSDIESALNHILRRLPNLEILRVDDNVNEWVEVKTSLGEGTSNFRINSKDEEDICGKAVCCKLSSVQHRFKSQNYRLTKHTEGNSENCLDNDSDDDYDWCDYNIDCCIDDADYDSG